MRARSQHMEDKMITTTARPTVSAALLSAALCALALGACARNPAPTPWDEAALNEETLSFRFDNQAQTNVDVYLITQQRQFRLGRVAPGARVTLRIPGSVLTPTSGFVRLAVLADAPISVDPAHDPNSTFTIVQPVASLVAQQWTFNWTPLASPEIRGAPTSVGRR